MNKLFLVGRVGKKDIKSFGSGSKVANLQIADKKRGYKKADGSEVHEETTWFDVSVWGKLSDVVEKFVEVGDRIAIEGEMYSQEWEKDGVKRTSMRVRCEKLELLGDSKKEGTQTPANEES